MKIGFTGTQTGMTDFQRDEVRKLLDKFRPNEIHHGDCIGSDAEFHYMFCHWHCDNDTEHRNIMIHPPSNSVKMAYTFNAQRYPIGLRERISNTKFKLILGMKEPEQYLERNRRIVEESDILIATPKELEHTLRSGTWATIRHAWHKKKEVIVVPPLTK